MSEDENFWLAKYREDFINELEGLNSVTTNKELREQTKRLDITRDKLLEHDEDFRKFIDAQTAKNQLRAALLREEANRQVKMALLKHTKTSSGKWTMPPDLPPNMVVRKR